MKDEGPGRKKEERGVRNEDGEPDREWRRKVQRRGDEEKDEGLGMKAEQDSERKSGRKCRRRGDKNEDGG